MPFSFASAPILRPLSYIYIYLQFFYHCHYTVSCVFQMEDLDEHLLITKIEVSSWKDQLKQVVSHFQLINIIYAIQSISI